MASAWPCGEITIREGQSDMEKTCFIYALTPIHAGTGKGLGYIDMPIAREKITGWPYIPGSSIKGVIRSHFDGDPDSIDEFNSAFGTSAGDDGIDTGTAGGLVVTDAGILCLPVRSFYGTFAWVTSPFCLNRLMKNAGHIPNPDNDHALITTTSALNRDGGKIYLEELDIEAEEFEAVNVIAKAIADNVFAGNDDWHKIFMSRFAIVDDDIFTFLCDTGTEVNARIRIDDETGTAAQGALWYEEDLPAETILAGAVWCAEKLRPIMEKYCGESLTLQLGGKASTGKGQARVIFGGMNHAD